MNAFITPIKEKDRSSLAGKRFFELPVGTVASIEGQTYLRTEDFTLWVNNLGELKTISDDLLNYVIRKKPTVIYGTFRFYPLG